MTMLIGALKSSLCPHIMRKNQPPHTHTTSIPMGKQLSLDWLERCSWENKCRRRPFMGFGRLLGSSHLYIQRMLWWWLVSVVVVLPVHNYSLPFWKWWGTMLKWCVINTSRTGMIHVYIRNLQVRGGHNV